MQNHENTSNDGALKYDILSLLDFIGDAAVVEPACVADDWTTPGAVEAAIAEVILIYFTSILINF